MRLLIVSATGYALGWGPHLEREGHAVEVHTGSMDQLRSSNYSVAIFDSPVFVSQVDNIAKTGTKILGISKWSRLLQQNEKYRQEVIHAIGYTPLDKQTGEKVTVTCWFNGHNFISKVLVFNYDRAWSGDLGITVPSAGYMAYFNVDDSKLVKEILTPLAKFLRKADHRGCFSVDCVVTKDKILVSNISAAITKPYTQAIFENTTTSKSDALLAILEETSKPLRYIDPWTCGVMVSTYPYPYAAPEEPVDVIGINPANIKHSWLMDVSQLQDKWQCGTLSGCAGFITARGVSPQEATRRAYRTLKNITMPNIQYRNDIGKGVHDRYDTLKKQGLL